MSLGSVHGMTSVELERELQVRAVMAQDKAAGDMRRAAAVQGTVTAVDLESERTRADMLAQMRRNATAARIGGAPRSFVLPMPDGAVVYRASEPVRAAVAFRMSDEQDAEWQRRQRDADDRALIAWYGAEQCLALGAVDQAAVDRHADLVPPRKPKPAPYNLERSVAG